MLTWLRRMAAPAAAFAALALAPMAAEAAKVPIVGFVPLPGTTAPVITLSSGVNGTLSTGVGASSLLTTIQYPGLLAAYGGTGVIGPSTLTLTSFTEEGPATSVSGTITQALSDGTFAIYAGAGTSGELLLTGFVTDAEIQTNGLQGSVLSGEFNYTGGTLFSLFPAAGLTNPGEFSIALNTIIPTPLTVDPDGTLSGFTANASGIFSAETTGVPLPAVAWVGFALLGGLGGKRGLSALRRRPDVVA